MRPLDQRSEPGETDDGAVMIWVALMIVVLLGVGALVIDVGALLVERRELQNGADAAALAVAQDCAEGNCGTGGGAGIAKQYADLNAGDDVAAIGSGTPCGVGPGLSGCAEPAPSGASGATGWVRVNTGTETPDGGNQVSFLLAPLISALTGKTVHAGAVAAWGPPLTAATLPFTFCKCYFERLPREATGTLPTGLATVYVKSGNTNQQPVDHECAQRSAPGGTVEGGFGWLRVTGTDCSVTLTGDTTVTAPSKPGNRAFTSQSGCSYDLIRNQTVVLPLFSDVVETGANATYTIEGFVGFEIHGYRLPGSTYGVSCDVPEGVNGNGNNIFCFVGKFVPTVVGDGDFGGTDFGARVVKMVG